MATIEQLLTEAINQRNLFADNLTIKGVESTHSETFNSLVKKILSIEGGGIDTSDATATPEDILLGKTGYVKGLKIEGIIESIDETEYIPTVKDKIIQSGQYLSGNQIIKGDINLIPSNIKNGVEIFGVLGTYSGGGGSSKNVLLDTNECLDVNSVLSLYGDSVYIYTSTSVTGVEIDTLSNVYTYFSSVQNNYIEANSGVYGIKLGNWTESNCSNGVLFVFPVELSGSALVMINAYISSWMNDTLNVHLLTSTESTEEEIISDLKTKILNSDYVYSKSVIYTGSNSRNNVYTELSDIPDGTYYIYIDGTKTGNNDNLTYYSVEVINL